MSSATKAKHRSVEFLACLRQVEKAVPAGLEVHAILDDDATHKTAAVEAWLRRPPRWHLHFIPTQASWLNQVERFFARIGTEHGDQMALRFVSGSRDDEVARHRPVLIATSEHLARLDKQVTGGVILQPHALGPASL